MIPERFRDGSLTGRDHPSWKGGWSTHPLHGIWRAMVRRCTNPKDKNYPGYGGRGISVCAEWGADFSSFLRDVGDRPACVGPTGRALYSLDRIDNDGNYEPANVKWSTQSEQLRNRRERMMCPLGHPKEHRNSQGRLYCVVCKRYTANAYTARQRAKRDKAD